jgi:hypothetical protein
VAVGPPPQGSRELNPGGTPYGFFHEPLERFPDGYPIILDTHLSAWRAEEAVTFMREGGYLSASLTKTLRAQLVTYNPDAQVFGYWRLSFTWQDSGDISTNLNLLGLPAVSYGEAIGTLKVNKFVPDFVLILLILGYVILTARDVYRQFADQIRRKSQKLLRRVTTRSRWGLGASAASASRSKVTPGEFPDGNPFAADDTDSSDDDRLGEQSLHCNAQSLGLASSTEASLHRTRPRPTSSLCSPFFHLLPL